MDVQKYTAQKLGEQMVAAELHLTDYLQENGGIPTELPLDLPKDAPREATGDSDFCIECLSKHALAIAALAQEGTQFFDNDPYFAQVYDVATNMYDETPKFCRESAVKCYTKLRELRKALVAKHLILGSMKEPQVPSGHQHI